MNKKSLTVCAVLILLISLFATPIAGFAWWEEGHKVVAKIAYRELKPNVRKNIAKRMGVPVDMLEQSMIEESTWADRIKNSRKETASWHYVNKPYFVGIEETDIQINRANVASKTVDFISILEETRHEKGRDEQDAFRFLLHFAGDIHCPMHNVGLYTAAGFGKFSHDLGGNLTKCGSRGNLHAYWDGVPLTLMEKKYGSNYNRFADAVCKAYPRSSLKDELQVKDVEVWSDGSHKLATLAYFTNCRDDSEGYLKQGDKMTPQYETRAENIVMKQLALAGYRLADVLNSIFDY